MFNSTNFKQNMLKGYHSKLSDRWTTEKWELWKIGFKKQEFYRKVKICPKLKVLFALKVKHNWREKKFYSYLNLLFDRTEKYKKKI